MHRRLQGLTTALVLATAVGCSAKEEPASAAADSAPPVTGAAAGAIQGANVVTIRAKDFAFEGPTEIPAGLTTFRMTNLGPDIHHAQIIKLDEGKTGADFAAALKAGGPPIWAKVSGGPNAPAPGQESNATSVLEPGNYALVCFVDTPDRVPHLMKGMIHDFKVVPASQPAAAEPTGATTIDMKDFAFEAPLTLTAGSHTFRVMNSGGQPHEVELFKLAPGKTMQDLQAWAHSFSGPPPAMPIGGVVALPPGAHAFFTANLDAGEYVLFCFFPDDKTKKLHFDLGMLKLVNVT